MRIDVFPRYKCPVCEDAIIIPAYGACPYADQSDHVKEPVRSFTERELIALMIINAAVSQVDVKIAPEKMEKASDPWATFSIGEPQFGNYEEIDVENLYHPEHENWVNRYSPY